MIDWFLALAIILLVVGIIGSAVPVIPGPLVSIIGVLVYWWSTGYTTPGTLMLVVILSTGIVAEILDTLAGFYGARKAEASRKTAYMAAAASILLLPFTGPFGIIIGTALVVIAREMMLGREFEDAVRTAFYTTLGLLGSVAVKVVLTVLMLILFLVSVFLL